MTELMKLIDAYAVQWSRSGTGLLLEENRAKVVAALEQLERDAARYQYIREGHFTGQWLLSEVKGGWQTGMDAAIDAAIGDAE